MGKYAWGGGAAGKSSGKYAWGGGGGSTASSSAPKKKAKEEDDGFSLGKVISAVSGAVGAPVGKALNALDAPRAAIVSTIQELDDLTEGKGFSGSDWKKQLDSRMGIGEFIENSDTDIDNIWVKRALGFAGDVALDPLTYLTGGAHQVATKGGKASRVSAREVSEMLARRGDTELSALVKGKRTAAVLPDEVLKDLNLSTGLMFGVGKTKGIIPGTKNIGLARAKVTNPLIDRATTKALPVVGKTVPELFDTHQAFAKMRKEPNGEGLIAASKEAIQRSRVESQGIQDRALSALNTVAKRHKNIDGPSIVNAVERPTASAAPEVAAAAAEFSNWERAVQEAGNAAVAGLKNPDGSPVKIGTIDNYVSRRATEAFREATAGRRSTKAVRKGKESIEKTRTNMAGEDWFGVKLTEETDNIADMNRIASEALGEDAVKVFEDDPWVIGKAYAASVARFVERERLHGGLQEMGLERFFDQKGLQGAIKREPKKIAQRDALAKKAERGARLAAKNEKKAEKFVRKHVDEFDHATQMRVGFDQAMAEHAPRIAEIEADLALNPVKATKEKLEAEWFERSQAVEIAERAKTEAEVPIQEAMRLQALASTHAARAAKAGTKALDIDAGLKKLASRKAEMQDMISDGLRSMEGDPGRWTNPQVAELIQEVADWNTPENANKLWKVYDGVLSRWKAQALLSPGFHFRNFFGGVFNNALAETDMSSYIKFEIGLRQLKRNGGDLAGIKDPAVRSAFEAMERYPVYGGADVRDLADITGMNANRKGLLAMSMEKVGKDPKKIYSQVDPTSLDFKPYTMNRTAAEYVEKTLRGPLFVDRILKGFSPEDALAAVHKYHFDYSDLSKWEATWGRRVIPFYTWTRKNLPLQLEGLVSKPGVYTRYLHAKRNIELGTEEDEFVPDYMQRALAIKTPFSTSGKGFYGGEGEDPIYSMPDMPFVGLDETLNVDTALSSLTPVIKTPMEVYSNRSWFTGSEIEPDWAEADKMPQTWVALGIPQVLSQLDGHFGAPKISKDEDGNWLIGRKGAYLIEQAMPVLGRARRNIPNEKHQKDRVLANHLSFLLGIGARTLTDDEQRRERDRRNGE